MTGTPAERDPDGLTFEELVDELEGTIARMAGGSLGIEEVTALYERAGRLHVLATERLEAITARIEKLTTGPPSAVPTRTDVSGPARSS